MRIWSWFAKWICLKRIRRCNGMKLFDEFNSLLNGNLFLVLASEMDIRMSYSEHVVLTIHLFLFLFNPNLIILFFSIENWFFYTILWKLNCIELQNSGIVFLKAGCWMHCHIVSIPSVNNVRRGLTWWCWEEWRISVIASMQMLSHH